MCPERAFPQGAAAQEALTAMWLLSHPELCVYFYWLHPIAAKSGDVGEILVCSPLSSFVCLTSTHVLYKFCGTSLAWWGGLCGLGQCASGMAMWCAHLC